jgi:hypothetical protein
MWAGPQKRSQLHFEQSVVFLGRGTPRRVFPCFDALPASQTTTLGQAYIEVGHRLQIHISAHRSDRSVPLITTSPGMRRVTVLSLAPPFLPSGGGVTHIFWQILPRTRSANWLVNSGLSVAT